MLLCEVHSPDLPPAFLPGFHVVYDCPAGGGAGKGLLIAVKHNRRIYVGDAPSNSTSLWVQLPRYNTAPLFLGACFVPPTGSLQLGTRSLDARFADLQDTLAELCSAGRMLCAGDFNARMPPSTAHGHLLRQVVSATPVCALHGFAPRR